jgi:predicted ATPase/tetratricopeptide (TPR) repeat protein
MPGEHTERRTRVTRSLLRARAVQLGMLPDPPKLPELDIGVHYEACEELGGDFYDFIQVSPTELGIVLADVSGHGLDAALMMAAAKKTLQIHGRRIPSPAEVLKIACEDLAGDLPSGSFVTVWYGVINLQTGLLRYASAGHNPLLHRPLKGKLREHSAKGVVLGAAFVQAMRDNLEEATLQLAPGDWVLLYTDGVNEAVGKHDDQYGMQRLHAALAAAPGDTAEDLLQHVRDDVADFCAGRNAEDDVTLLALCFRGGNEPELAPAWQPRVQSNLPQRADNFFGREDEMLSIASALEEGGRAIVILGVAGLGKTRLALEAAREVASDYPGGTWFISLENCTDTASVVSAIAGALQLTLASATELVEALASRGATLLLLDNAETCVDAVQDVLSKLQKLPHGRTIVTSQLRIGSPGEFELEVRPLPTPGAKARNVSLDSAIEYPAVRLLVDRAARVAPKFALSGENLPAVLGICAELEGMPLAIELAASRLGQLTPQEIFNQLRTPTNKIAVLRARVGEAMLPYRSMREALEWSYALLNDWEQAAFRQVCAFRGGFFLEAAVAVLQLPGDITAINAIDSLLDKSFLSRESTPYGTRFNTYSSLRDFATRLTEPPESQSFRVRHMQWFADYGAKWHAGLTTRDVIESHDRIALDHDNLRVALRTAIDRNDKKQSMRILEALFQGRDRRGASDIWPLLDEVYDKFGNSDDLTRCLLLQMRALPLLTSGNMAQCMRLLDEAVVAAEGAGLFPPLSSSLIMRARAHSNLGNDDKAVADFERVISDATKIGEQRAIGVAKISLGNMRSRQSRFAEAEKLLTEAAAILDRVGDTNQATIARSNLMIQMLRQKRFDEAEKALADVHPFLKRMNGRDGLGTVELSLARLHEGRGELEEALEHYMRSHELFTEAGHRLNSAITQLDIGALSVTVGDLDAARAAVESALAFARSSHAALLEVRAVGQLGIIELECGNLQAARELFVQNETLLKERDEVILTLTNKGLLAWTELRLRNVDAASTFAIEALQKAEAGPEPKSDVMFLLLGVRARVLQAQGRHANANRFAARAREIADVTKIQRYSTSYIERLGLELIDVPASPDEGIRVRVRCPICGQRYMGSEKRIRTLVKCRRCGMTPFKPLKVSDGES